MRIGIAKELVPEERCVTRGPESAARLRAAGAGVLAEKGAGDTSFFPESVQPLTEPALREQLAQHEVTPRIRCPPPGQRAGGEPDSVVRLEGALQAMVPVSKRSSSTPDCGAG